MIFCMVRDEFFLSVKKNNPILKIPFIVIETVEGNLRFQKYRTA